MILFKKKHKNTFPRKQKTKKQTKKLRKTDIKIAIPASRIYFRKSLGKKEF